MRHRDPQAVHPISGERHTAPLGRVRPTVRLKLALLCGAPVALAGAMVLFATYFLLSPGVDSIGVVLQGGELIGGGQQVVATVSPSGQGQRVAATVSPSSRGQQRAATVSPSGHGQQGAATVSPPSQVPAACASAARALGAVQTPVPPVVGAHPVPPPVVIHLKRPPRSSPLLRCLRAWAKLPGSQPEQAVGLFVRQVSATQRAVDLHQLLVRGAGAVAALALLGLASAWWMAGRLLRPLQVMTRRVQQLSERTPLGRIRLAGPNDELKRLADTFDALLARLDAALAADRTFVANASHELRTPLAIQETILDVALADPAADVAALRQMGERLRQVNARSGRLIEGLLALARSQQGPHRWEAVDLADVAQAALEAVAPEARWRAVRLETDILPAAVRGDPVLLERLACNLLQNAVRHNLNGGWARLTTLTAAGGAVLSVANTGPVVAVSEVGRLFEPFHRAGRERTDSSRGTGLGLSIVKAVAEAHGGTVTAEARPGGGLDVTVSLPSGTDGRPARPAAAQRASAPRADPGPGRGAAG